MGKSGHVARKIAATLASTGTPAHYVHPAEASHGDLGMIQPDDVIIALSWSGETAELADIIAYSKRFRVPLIAMTSNADLDPRARGRYLPRAAEGDGSLPERACAHHLHHHAAGFGRRLGRRAPREARLHGGAFPGLSSRAASSVPGSSSCATSCTRRAPSRSSPIDARMDEAIEEIGRKGFGSVIVVNADGTLAGIVTDGDLRRNLRPDLGLCAVTAIMSRRRRAPSRPTTSLATALEMQETSKITALIVVENDRPVGLVHYLDLLRVGAA